MSRLFVHPGTEIVGPSKRKFAAIVNKYFYSLGQLLLAGVAYRLRSWSSIELAISLPALLFVSYWWYVPPLPTGGTYPTLSIYCCWRASPLG